MQIFREALPFLLLGSQDGIQNTPFADTLLKLRTGNVVEDLLYEQHAHSETERYRNPEPQGNLGRKLYAGPMFYAEIFAEPQYCQTGQSDGEQHPREIVFGPA